ncbi:DinB family protein [Acinetobacter stercoris]|nr:DinB family protein [Acinetobacter stercoris]
MYSNHLLRMAEYNIWATARLVQALEPVSIDDFNKDTGLFFKSISGTLNHLLLGEHYLWYPRFKEGISPSIPLDTIVHTDKHILLRELRQKTLNWSSFIKQLDDRILDGKLSYRTTSGQQFTLPYSATLMHVFNHGTHHRGQITAALTHLGYESPVLDLVYMLVEQHNQS